MGAGVNGEVIILLKVVYLADSRPKNGFLPRMFVGPFALPVGNHSSLSNTLRSQESNCIRVIAQVSIHIS